MFIQHVGFITGVNQVLLGEIGVEVIERFFFPEYLSQGISLEAQPRPQAGSTAVPLVFNHCRHSSH